jgi:hypothetical protein
MRHRCGQTFTPNSMKQRVGTLAPERNAKIPAEFDETKTIIKSDRIGGLT